MEGKKILIADDEADILNVLSKKLSENNYSVIAVSKGKDAVERSIRDNPDLVLLDIAMPDMDGYAVASALQEEKKTKAIPIIFLTGKELRPEGILERIERLGAYDFITKPFTFEGLLAKIKEAIG